MFPSNVTHYDLLLWFDSYAIAYQLSCRGAQARSARIGPDAAAAAFDCAVNFAGSVSLPSGEEPRAAAGTGECLLPGLYSPWYFCLICFVQEHLRPAASLMYWIGLHHLSQWVFSAVRDRLFVLLYLTVVEPGRPLAEV
jgi:hypothetical protein